MKKISKTANAPINAALFALRDNPDFLLNAVAAALPLSKAMLISDDSKLIKPIPDRHRMNFMAAGLDRAMVDRDLVVTKLKHLRSPLIVDMRWAIANTEGMTNLERWGAIADHLSREWSMPIISLYDQDLVIEEQMQTAFRVHSQFLAPSGLHANPYWLPSQLLESASLDEQLSFMLGRVVPDYAGLHTRRKGGELFARGATPSWLAKPAPGLVNAPNAPRWHIHCFGKLRVFIGGRDVNWQIAGSTPKKTRTLFAYLLQSGEKGADAEPLSELLWPEEDNASVKRARLHHTIAMLRKTLGSAASVLRDGDYYRLNAPQGSWIDIDTFEQLCRRGLALFKRNEHEEALQLYLAADKLYAGDLFGDVPRVYTESDQENWCVPRRIWLREMALKLQTDLTRALMKTGRTREALEHCMKALALDPASDAANAEAMRIFDTQGRVEAVQRQYRQYKQAVAAMGASESSEMKSLFRELDKT